MEYRFEDKGNEVKITTTRVQDPAPAPLNSIGSCSCPKFCDPVKEDDISRLTMVSIEDIPIENPSFSGSRIGETTASGSPLDVTSIGGDHWTFKCPYKDHAPQTRTSVESSPTASGPAEPPVCPICLQAADRSVADMMGCGDDDSTIRVMNLSANTSKSDLYNLCCPFGIINLLSLELDEKTGSLRQFGIVEFDQRDDADEAIKWLNGYSYDDLTLQVEMTTTGLKEAYESPPICASCMGAIETSVHVTNLSEAACELDLYNLFCPFGIINRFYLALVDKTGSASQSGIMEFDQREDAEEAINWLNGYEYDNQILQVKWATGAELSVLFLNCRLK